MPDIKPGMINKDHFQIFITHMPTNEKINFDGWVTGFADNFSSTWKGTPVYGRMDDLYTFQRTARRISLAFDVVASNQFEAAKNIRKLNKLAQFLYPVYSEPTLDAGARGAQALQGAPLLKMKWNGLISNVAEGTDLIGFLRGFSYDPDIQQGQFFIPGRGTNEPFIAYQTHTVKLDYIVIHSHLTGWTQKTVQTTRGSTRYIFGGNEERPLGSTFPHAVSDPVRLPAPKPNEPAIAAPDERPKEHDGSGLPYDHLDDDDLANEPWCRSYTPTAGEDQWGLDPLPEMRSDRRPLTGRGTDPYQEDCISESFQTRAWARMGAASEREVLTHGAAGSIWDTNQGGGMSGVGLGMVDDDSGRTLKDEDPGP